MAYDPVTGKASTQTMQHVWINHDHDLLDVTLRTGVAASAQDASSKAQQAVVRAHSSQAPPADETIHTTANHPWLTTDRGWVLAGIVYASYDALDRAVWRNTSNSPTGASVTYSYDSTAGGNQGIGRLTGESFTGGPSHSLSGSYADTYDGRGQTTASTLTVGSTSYPVSQTFDDAGSVLTQTYPTGETVTTSYTAQEWFAGLTTSAGSTTLVNSVRYDGSGYGGPAGLPSSLSLGNGVNGTYSVTASYNALLQPTDTKLTRVSDSAVLFEQQPVFDPVGNVKSVATTLPAGTDSQTFCYDEQDRLTWASSASATGPCGSNTAGTLSAATYTQSFAYDNLNRLTSGPLGSYSYGDSAHLHGATSIGGQWSGSDDASGNVTCRAPSSATTCALPATGAQLSYDNEGRLTAWQNTPSSPTTTDSFLYDGEGHRAEQQVTTSGTTTTTVYVGAVEEVATTGSSTSITTSYYAGGQRVAEAVNGVISYVASDGLGSATVALSASGTVQAAARRAPIATSTTARATASSSR
jgi:hypothetical protein